MRKSTYYKKREHKPDTKHGRIDMGRFINYLMEDGKRSVAEKVFYSSLERVKEVTKNDPVKVFEDALENVSPRVEVVSRRVGGANYQIPREVRQERKFFLACNWIISAAKNQKGKPMHERLSQQIIEAAKNEGEAIKKKQTMHRMAEANRAFASFLR
ncbi:MAG: 30S ribosomal protein S7 [Candidatus Paceibacterota bacterium]